MLPPGRRAARRDRHLLRPRRADVADGVRPRASPSTRSGDRPRAPRRPPRRRRDRHRRRRAWCRSPGRDRAGRAAAGLQRLPAHRPVPHGHRRRAASARGAPTSPPGRPSRPARRSASRARASARSRRLRTGRSAPAARSPPARRSRNPGDLIVWDGRHIGIVESVLPDGRIQTIEGNSSEHGLAPRPRRRRRWRDGLRADVVGTARRSARLCGAGVVRTAPRDGRTGRQRHRRRVDERRRVTFAVSASARARQPLVRLNRAVQLAMARSSDGAEPTAPTAMGRQDSCGCRRPGSNGAGRGGDPICLGHPYGALGEDLGRLFIRASVEAGRCETFPSSTEDQMRCHANARLSPIGRRLLIDRVERWLDGPCCVRGGGG